MRSKHLLAVPVILALAAAPGCKGDSQEPAPEPSTQAAPTEQAPEAAAPAQPDVDTWLANTERELKQLEDSIEALGDKIGDLPEAAQEDAKPAVDALNETANRLKDELDEAREAAPAEIQRVRGDIEKGMAELHQRWKAALTAFETAGSPD